jgi:hypothetical protein
MEGADAQMSWMTLPDVDTQMNCHYQRRFMAQGREKSRKCSYVPSMLKWHMLNRKKEIQVQE